MLHDDCRNSNDDKMWAKSGQVNYQNVGAVHPSIESPVHWGLKKAPNIKKTPSLCITREIIGIIYTKKTFTYP
jgi:hypothetical protein